jgi:Ca-activated chloride channel family protein
MIEAVACMTGTDGTRIALQDVRMNALLRDLLAEVTMTQIYRNEEQCAIEAVYTFPLPPAAVLLGLEVTLGERRLQATIVEKKAAERRYEEAVADGDSAVMLEQAEPGLYTLNLGNLLPGEDACVTLHYALLQRWDRNRLRLLIPTTIAPRYGRSPLSPAQQSEVALTVENRFTLQVENAGTLAQARVTCPTHAVATESVPTGLALRLHDERAVMDRDFVLEFLRDTQGRGCAWTDRDGDGAAAIACFQPSLPAGTASPPLSLVVIVDCSGSMAGDAIAQARKALATILTRLTPADRLEIIAFGSRTCAGFGSLQGCSRDALARAEAIAAALQADLGGTEIGGALRAAFDTFGADLRGDVFLITDGEVADWQPHMAAAAERGHRIFTVGVGNAVSEAFVRGLADATGGACELVTPREGMAGRVVRHFERLRTPRTRSLEIHWPEGAIG